MVSLRSLTCAGLFLISSVANADVAEEAPQSMWAPTPGDVITFDVLRQGNKFGTHIVEFEEADDGSLRVIVDVDLKAGLGPITVFRYQLDATELWADGELVSLEGAVNDDGTRERVVARTEGEFLQVSGDGFEGQIDQPILPASHWNFAQTNAQKLLSSENGEIIDVIVERLGKETIVVAGEAIEASKFMMDSDIDVALWYDNQGRWVKLAFEARGQSIEYVLRDLY